MQEHRRSHRNLGVKMLQIGFVLYRVSYRASYRRSWEVYRGGKEGELQGLLQELGGLRCLRKVSYRAFYRRTWEVYRGGKKGVTGFSTGAGRTTVPKRVTGPSTGGARRTTVG